LSKLKLSGYVVDPKSPEDSMIIALAGMNNSGEVFVSYGGFNFLSSDPSEGGLVYLKDESQQKIKFQQI